MESSECDSFEKTVGHDQELAVVNVQSPSQALLERLTKLRKWQEEQREKLLQVQWNSQTTKDFVYSHHKKDSEEMYPYQETKIKAQIDAPSSSLPSSVAPEMDLKRSLCEERVKTLIGSEVDASQEMAKSYQSALYTDQAAATWPLQSSKHECGKSEVSQTKSREKYEEMDDGRNLADKVNQGARLQVFGSSQVDETSIGNFFEKKLMGKTEKEVYSKMCEPRPTRLMSSIPEVTPHTIPKPKQRYLRKGEGTRRFGMKTVRLKKTKAPLDEKIMGNTIISSACDKSLPRTSLKMNAKKPVNRLLLRKIPNSVGNSADMTPDNKEALSVYGSRVSVQKRGPGHSQEGLPKPVSDATVESQSYKEREELFAFEKLEELAEDSSFASNSSTVLNLLQQGHQSAPPNNPFQPQPSFPPQGTPVIEYSDQQKPIPQKGDAESTTGNRTIKTKENVEDRQQSLLSVSQVLDKLKTIVGLEYVGAAVESEAETERVRGNLADELASLSPETMSHFASGTWGASTSTPAHSEALPRQKPHVRFRSEVLEYELSDADEDDTLTDAPNITGEDSDLITTSDLEALALNIYRPSGQPQTASLDRESKQNVEYREDSDTEVCSLESDVSSQGTSGESRPKRGVQPTALHFSPPRRPKDSSSDYIWSIFGKGRRPKRSPCQKKATGWTRKNKASNVKHLTKSGHDESVAPVRKLQGEPAAASDEIETYKALILAKICELEKETNIFRRENSKLQKLQQEVEEEKKQLGNDKQKLQDEVAKEKKRLQEYIDCERNRIWKEKQETKKSAPSITDVREHSLEVVYLKEQLHDMQEEAKKKASLHQFSIKKLNEKIRVLEEENKQLKNRNRTLQDLEKENIQLKHKLDRTKLNKKPVLVDQAGNAEKGKWKQAVKTSTINSINRSLDRMAQKKVTGNYHERKGEPSACKTVHTDVRQSEKNYDANFASGVEGEGQAKTEEIVNISIEKAENYYGESAPEKDSAVAHQQPSKVLGNENKQFVSAPKGTRKDLGSRSARKSLDDKNVEFTEKYRDDGTKEIIYANGNRKEVFSSGLVVVSYYNGDKKEIHGDRTVYVYGSDLTSHTTFNDGREVLVFPSGQRETRLPDGSSEIVFTDGSRKVVSEDGTETCSMKNGTVVRSNPDGSKVFEFVGGQREVHADGEKRREYPDGTVKILHRDGRTETHYKTGRTRIKNREGDIILDTYQDVP